MGARVDATVCWQDWIMKSMASKRGKTVTYRTRHNGSSCREAVLPSGKIMMKNWQGVLAANRKNKEYSLQEEYSLHQKLLFKRSHQSRRGSGGCQLQDTPEQKCGKLRQPPADLTCSQGKSAACLEPKFSIS